LSVVWSRLLVMDSTTVPRVRSFLAGESGGGLWSLSDVELTAVVDGVHGLAAQVDALCLRVVREADRRDLGKAAGATGTADWLSGRERLRPEDAGRRVKLARALEVEFGATAEALDGGQISVDHATVVTRAVQALPREAGPATRAEAERVLVGQARVFHPKDLYGLGRTVLNTVDPDLADQVLAKKLAAEEATAARERELSLHQDPYGPSTFLRGKLDPVTAERLRVALEPLAKPLPTTANGPDPRTHGQRLGDGFAELLRRYLDTGRSPSHGGVKPQIVVTIGWDQLMAGAGVGTLLHTNTPVSAETVQQLACDAEISWFGVIDGEVKLSDGTRLFAGKARKLLDLRDRGCAFPGCSRPPAWCHAHHITSWIHGGPTTTDNGVLLCGTHHRPIHGGLWHVRMADVCIKEFFAP
jgi:hypothetical protein